jgi:hypothetical protein
MILVNGGDGSNGFVRVPFMRGKGRGCHENGGEREYNKSLHG